MSNVEFRDRCMCKGLIVPKRRFVNGGIDGYTKWVGEKLRAGTRDEEESSSNGEGSEADSLGNDNPAETMATEASKDPDPAVRGEPPNKMSKRDLYKPPTTSEINQLKETENLFHSTLFRMQITELLSEVKLTDKRCRQFDKAIDLVKNIVLNMVEGKKHELQSVKWLKKSGIKVPLSPGLPETKGHFQFIPPRDVKLTGSYLCGTCVRPKVHADLLLVMPKECFDHKDFLNHRYLRKRALYLCKVAMALSGTPDIEEVKFTYHHGNHLKPILIVSVKDGHHAIELHLHAVPEENYFKLNRFSVSKSNVRAQWFHNSSENEQKEEVATPFYNSTMLEDVSALATEEYLQEQLKASSSGVKEGIVLLKIWLRQRGLDQGQGGFSGHIMSLYILYLLSQRRLNPHMSSYQVMRNTLLRLAQSDWTVDGITMCTDSTDVNLPTLSEFHRHFSVVLVDHTGYMNVCYAMDRTMFTRVKHEASIAVAMLDDKTVDSFTALFITRLPFSIKFDHLVHISPLDILDANVDRMGVAERHLDSAGDSLYTCLPAMLRLMERGLGPRTTLMQAKQRPTPTWSVMECPEDHTGENKVTIGLLLDSEFAFNVLDRGPSADSQEAKEFRAFWGDRSDLRRFQDGGICEAVLWLDKATANQKQLVCGHVIKYVLNRHAGIPASNIHYIGGQTDGMLHLPVTFGPAPCLPYGTGEEQNVSMLYVYENLCKELRALTDLPLTITSIHGVDPCFRYTEVFPPLPCTLEQKKSKWPRKNTKKYLLPSVEKNCPVFTPSLKVVCLLESSSKWPEDIEAMRRLKAAFHIQLSECLRSSCSLPVRVSTTHIDVLKENYVFRVVLAYTKEISILKTVRTPDGMVRKRDTDAAVALVKEIVSLPRLTSTLHGLQQQHNSFSSTVRLAKRWVCAQFLGDHVDPVALELIVASLYLAPAPYTAPRSGMVGFQRFLRLLSTFDWNMTPLMINLNNEFTEADRAEIPVRFAKERTTLPLMFLSTPLDKYSSHWTKQSPTPPILHRLVLLAQKSSAIIEDQVLADKPSVKQVFRPATDFYDALIHLKKTQLPRQHERVDAQDVFVPAYNNATETSVFPVTDFDPVQMFLQELREAFDDLCLFFHDTHGGNVIGLLWKPPALTQKEFKVSHINYSRLQSAGTQGDMMLVPNIDAVLEDIKLMGKGLVDSIQLKER